MKVLLIYPPAFHIITTNLPDVVEEEKGHFPPLGLMYVASYLRNRTDYEVTILDTQVEELDYDGVRDSIAKIGPDVVGIQAMTFTLIDAIKTARIVKELNPATHVTIGGPHCNIYPNETLGIDAVDSIVLNEGEVSFAELVRCLEEGKDLDQVPGIGYKRNGQAHFTPPTALLRDLDELPHPSRDLIPNEKYGSILSTFWPVTTMMTSRGCPYECVFCDRPYLGSNFRYRSAISVVDEMEEASRRFGIKAITMYDDTFSIRKERVHEICDLFVQRGLSVAWDMRTSVNAVDTKLLDALARANCTRIHYGIESGNEDIQNVIKKYLQLDRVERIVKYTRDLGIKTLGYFMIGNPTETREQMEQTIEFATRIGLDYAHISIHTPFPATESYKMGFEKNLYSEDYWREFAQDPREDFIPQVWDEVLSREELIDMMRHFYRRFYMRPSYLMNRLIEVRSFRELTRKARMGLGLLTRTKPMRRTWREPGRSPRVPRTALHHRAS